MYLSHNQMQDRQRQVWRESMRLRMRRESLEAE
jgi:hypothetical protein